jgi:LacI family transcriptional regulator
MKKAKKYGYTIPDDLQIIGFSDGVLAKHATPSLTTVSQHAQKIGEKSAEMLIEKLEDESLENRHKTEIIATELILRKTTK